MRVFLLWKRRCADVRAGTQAPPLRFRLGRLRVGGWFRLGNGLCMAYAFRLGACVQMPLIHVGEWSGRTKSVGLVLLIAQGWRR